MKLPSLTKIFGASAAAIAMLASTGCAYNPRTGEVSVIKPDVGPFNPIVYPVKEESRVPLGRWMAAQTSNDWVPEPTDYVDTVFDQRNPLSPKAIPSGKATFIQSATAQQAEKLKYCDSPLNRDPACYVKRAPNVVGPQAAAYKLDADGRAVLVFNIASCNIKTADRRSNMVTDPTTGEIKYGNIAICTLDKGTYWYQHNGKMTPVRFNNNPMIGYTN